MFKYIYLYTCKDTTPKGIPVFEAVTGNSHLTFPIPVLKYFNNSFKIGSYGDKNILQLTVVSLEQSGSFSTTHALQNKLLYSFYYDFRITISIL